MSENEPVEIWGEYDMEIDWSEESPYLERTTMNLQEYLLKKYNEEREISKNYSFLDVGKPKENIKHLQSKYERFIYGLNENVFKTYGGLTLYLDDIIQNYNIILDTFDNSSAKDRPVILLTQKNKNKNDIIDVSSVTNIGYILAICEKFRFEERYKIPMDKRSSFQNLGKIVITQDFDTSINKIYPLDNPEKSDTKKSFEMRLNKIIPIKDQDKLTITKVFDKTIDEIYYLEEQYKIAIKQKFNEFAQKAFSSEDLDKTIKESDLYSDKIYPFQKSEKEKMKEKFRIFMETEFHFSGNLAIEEKLYAHTNRVETLPLKIREEIKRIFYAYIDEIFDIENLKEIATKQVFDVHIGKFYPLQKMGKEPIKQTSIVGSLSYEFSEMVENKRLTLINEQLKKVFENRQLGETPKSEHLEKTFKHKQLEKTPESKQSIVKKQRARVVKFMLQ